MCARIIKLKYGTFEQHAAVYNYLPGHTIPWEAYTKDHIKLLGQAMSDMHTRLQTLDCPLPNAADEYILLTQIMADYFSDKGVQKALRDKLKLSIQPDVFKSQREFLGLLDGLDGQQPLHMDFVRGNILFTESTAAQHMLSLNKVAISGILDFEKTALGHPIFDIARTLAFLLVDCKYKTEEKIRKYFLVSGYNKRGANNFSEARLLEGLINIFLMHDLYKFLRHNPYEFLNQNQHFIRTQDLLIKRSLLMLK